jgi:hypothetical protein
MYAHVMHLVLAYSSTYFLHMHAFVTCLFVSMAA